VEELTVQQKSTTNAPARPPAPRELCPYCHAFHRDWHRLAKCRWPRALWVQGNGSYACLALCGGLSMQTVELYASLDDAKAAKLAIDETGCGSACWGQHGHTVFDLTHLFHCGIGPDGEACP
jgi:hypothetical protein